jgi:hypothetical protein
VSRRVATASKVDAPIRAAGERAGQNVSMSRRQGSAPSGDVVRGAGSAAVKGAVLIGLAVVLGIFLLQQIDTGETGPVDDPNGTSGAPRTTTTEQGSTTTTAALAPARTPEQLHIIVLNGGAPAGSAGATRTDLVAKGYTNNDQANTWTGHQQTGTTVMCKGGLDREAAALAVAVGEGATVQAFPTPPPPFTDNVDCAVVVGA